MQQAEFLQDFFAAHGEQFLGERTADFLGVQGAARLLLAIEALAVDGGDDRLHFERLVRSLGVDADGYLAAALDACEEGAFRSRRRTRRRVVEEGDEGERRLIVRTRLDGECALSDGGQADFARQDLGDAVMEAQALESGDGEDDRVEVFLFELLEPRVHVAAQADDLKVGPLGEELCAAAKARRADLRALGKVRERLIARTHDGVAGVEALGHGGEHESFGQFRRHVLEAVHGEVDFAREHRLLKLLREKPLAADLRQRRIEHAVALRRHALLYDMKLRVFLPELRLYIVRLPKRELTAARTYNDGVFLHKFPSPLSYQA